MIDLEDNSLESKIFLQAAQRRIPVSGSIELLPLCNMNCDMCYVRLSPAEMQANGRLRSKSEWLSIAEQMKNAGTLFMLLTGGEPLLYPEFRELYLDLKQMGMILTLNTNGTLINEGWADFFGTFKPRRINITLYGSNSRTYTELCHYPDGFDRTMNGIRLLKERDVDMQLNVSAVRANRNDLEAIIKIGKEFYIPVSVDNYMAPASRERKKRYNYDSRLTPEDAAVVHLLEKKMTLGDRGFSEYRDKIRWTMENIIPEHEPRHMSCLAGKCSFTINWQGEMRPCVLMTEPAISVFESGFQQSWEYIVKETEKITLCSKCGTCRLRPVCQACAANALYESGSFDGVPEYLCRYSESVIRQLNITE